MANGYSRSPKLMKGALIRFSKSLLVPIPNVIVFQYNPETIKRSFAVSELSAVDKVNTDELSQPYDPRETISLTLELDATDALEEPASHPVAVIYGVADRIAAMEVLLYPVSTELASQLNIALSASVSASGISVSKKETVPVETSRSATPISRWMSRHSRRSSTRSAPRSRSASRSSTRPSLATTTRARPPTSPGPVTRLRAGRRTHLHWRTSPTALNPWGCYRSRRVRCSTPRAATPSSYPTW
jgi:hypothetical protein